MKLLRQIIDLLLYGNLWIALCALALYWETELLLNETFTWDSTAITIFFSTSFLYAANRIFGIKKVTAFSEMTRFKIIERYRNHILINGMLSALISIYYFLKLETDIQIAIFIAGIISLAYVLPIFNSGKRLRDQHFIKIFLVTITWSIVTVLIPYLKINAILDLDFYWLFVERTLFIFAITIPFDVRDIETDQEVNVKTIPNYFGIKKAINLAIFTLCAGLLIGIYLYQNNFYTRFQLLALSACYLIVYLLLKKSSVTQHDYYYSGLMDGSMILHFVLVWISTSI